MASIKKLNKGYKITLELGRNEQGKKIRKSKNILSYDDAKSLKRTCDELELIIKEKSVRIDLNDKFDDIIFKVNNIKNNIQIEKGQTFGNYLRTWLKEYKSHISQVTYEGYEKIIENFIIPTLGDIILYDLQAYHIQKYYSFLMQEKHLSANTVKHHHAVIHRSLKMGKKQRLLKENVAEFVELPPIPPFKGKLCDKDTLMKIIEECLKSSIRIPILIALFLGVRRSENIGTNWPATDLKKEEIKINQKVIRIKGKYLVSEIMKNDSSYRVEPIPNQLLRILIEWKIEQKELRIKFQNKAVYNDFICTMPNGDMMKPDYVTKKFKEILRKFGLEEMRLHDLRDAFATYLLEAGESIYYVSEWLGHSNVTTTQQRYSHIVPERKKEIARKVDKVFQLQNI